MKILVRNTAVGLIPWFDNDSQEKSKLKIGQDYTVEVKKIRNPKFHRKFFALLNVGYTNTSLKMPFDTYRKYVTIKAGYYTVYKTHKGELIEADSIAFNKMDDTKFEDVYNRVLDVILEDVGSSYEELESEISDKEQQILSFA